MIDIIIPAYNAHKTIDKCIMSIYIQNYSEYSVTIVNDGGDDYKDIISRYKDIMNIKEIKNSDNINRGAGYARQFGFDHTDAEYVTFIDADDTLYGTFALECLITGVTMNNGYSVCIGNFIEENIVGNIIHNEDKVWMFGKLYRRDFINKYNIRFCPSSRWNEDNGFNTCVYLCANEKEQINFISDVVYCWHDQSNSITRLDNCRYTCDKSFVGYIENMIWAIKHSEKYQSKDVIDDWSWDTLLNIYQYFIEICGRDRRFLRQAWKWIQLYFDKIMVPIYGQFDYNMIAAKYNNSAIKAYRRGSMLGIIPSITLYDFLYKLENHMEIEYEENDESDYFPSNSTWLTID